MNRRGVVTRRTKGFYYLRTYQGEEVECKVKGQLFKNSRFDNQIAVGDFVFYSKSDRDDVGLITSIKERKSFLSRNRVGAEAEQIIAANIDYLLVVASAKKPPFRVNLINRMLTAAAVGNINPVLILSKTDLVDTDYIEQLLEPYRKLNIEIIPFSIKDETANPRLLEILSGNVSVLAGQSGVGKSSLLNRLYPALSLKVGAVSAKTFKGSHTTTFAMMHQIAENSFVIDTPGIREFGLWHVSKKNLACFYPLISDFEHHCKHRDCRHIHEPRCSIKNAVKNGEIHETLYQGYISIYNSLE